MDELAITELTVEERLDLMADEIKMLKSQKDMHVWQINELKSRIDMHDNELVIYDYTGRKPINKIIEDIKHELLTLNNKDLTSRIIILEKISEEMFKTIPNEIRAEFFMLFIDFIKTDAWKIPEFQYTSMDSLIMRAANLLDQPESIIQLVK